MSVTCFWYLLVYEKAHNIRFSVIWNIIIFHFCNEKLLKYPFMLDVVDEGLVCIGDYNRAIGNDYLGVAGNHCPVSFGGELVRELLEDDNYVLLNNSTVTEGGPWTWESRADKSIKSCLDLCIMSANLVSFATKMIVDSQQMYCPKKVMMTRGRTKVIRSDHYSIVVQLEGMPRANTKVTHESRWNLNKPGGWDVYKVAPEEASEKMDAIIDDESKSIEEVMKKVDAIMDSVKYKAFDKTKPMTKKAYNRRLGVRLAAAQGLDRDERVKELMRKQFDQLEEEITKLKKNKFGRVTTVFKMREIVAGPRKAPQELHAVFDKDNKELIVSTEGIKKVTLEHCMDTLKDNEPEHDVEQLVTAIKDVHELRMEEDDDIPMEVTKDEFDQILEKFDRKNKRSYDFLLRAGDCFKNSIHKLCGRMIREEIFPVRFFETTLQQLWKRKFPRENLSNHRFLHLKDWLPKTCEAMVVSQMKTQILEAGTKYQIGGLPGHRVEEHLISLKAIISRCINTVGGVIINLVDIKTFFDSESLRGVMDSLYTAGIPMKAYRTWFNLNSKTVISVRTPAGLTETKEAGELCA